MAESAGQLDARNVRHEMIIIEAALTRDSGLHPSDEEPLLVLRRACRYHHFPRLPDTTCFSGVLVVVGAAKEAPLQGYRVCGGCDTSAYGLRVRTSSPTLCLCLTFTAEQDFRPPPPFPKNRGAISRQARKPQPDIESCTYCPKASSYLINFRDAHSR